MPEDRPGDPSDEVVKRSCKYVLCWSRFPRKGSLVEDLGGVRLLSRFCFRFLFPVGPFFSLCNHLFL